MIGVFTFCWILNNFLDIAQVAGQIILAAGLFQE